MITAGFIWGRLLSLFSKYQNKFYLSNLLNFIFKRNLNTFFDAS